MTITTTVVGAYPKPGSLPAFDWFQAEGGPDTAHPTARYAAAVAEMGEAAEARFREAVAEVIADQQEAGIDIVTDGEVRRENYIYYHCRHLAGVDFENLTECDVRGGNYRAWLPTITGEVRAEAPFLPQDWRAAQEVASRPVKVTLPGPMTIGDSVADGYYRDPRRRGAALARALNAEIKALAAAGCRHVQIDEPLFARRVDDALAYGFEHLEICFDGVPPQVQRIVHMCCGYPDRLDREDYPKAPRESYADLAGAIDAASIQAVSIEDAHRPNDLSLLERFRDTTVILGVVAIARSRVETVEEIAERLAAALAHIEPTRLVAAPDCGLGLLGRELARAKLGNLVAAARQVG